MPGVSEHDRERLKVVEALLTAQDNMVELVTIAAGSADDAQAHALVRERFGMSDEQAAAVLDIQVRRITRSTRSRLGRERENLIQKRDTAPGDNRIKPGLELVNNGSSALDLSTVTGRYYFTHDARASTFTYSFDYAALGCANVHGSFASMVSGAGSWRSADDATV